MTSARATATRCCSPPLNAGTEESLFPDRLTLSSAAATCSRIEPPETFRARRPNATFSKTVICGKRA